MPALRPFCCLRYLTFFGSNIFTFALPPHRLLLLLLLFGQYLAAEDTHLDDDDAVGRLRLCETVADVGAQRVQWHAPFAVPLGARNFRPAEPAGALDSDTLRPHAHRARDAFLHRAAKRDASLELQRDVLRHELRVEVGPAHLDDVQINFPLRQPRQLFLQLLDLGALLADNDAGTRRVDINLRLGRRTLDLDLREARVRSEEHTSE